MRPFIRLFALLGTALLALGSAAAVAQAPIGTASDVRPDAITDRAWLDDTAGALTPEQALAGEWTPYERVLARGHTKGITWLRLRIDPGLIRPAALGGDKRLVLRIKPSHLDEVSVFHSSDLRQPLVIVGDTIETTDDRPRWLVHSAVMPDATDPFEILLRARSQGSHIFKVQVQRWDDARDQDSQETDILLAFLVFVAAIVVVSVFSSGEHHDSLAALFIANQIVAMIVAAAVLGGLRLWAGDWISASSIDLLSAVGSVLFSLLQIGFHVMLLPQIGARPFDSKWIKLLLVQPAVALCFLAADFRQLALQLSVSMSFLGTPVCFIVACRAHIGLAGESTIRRLWSRVYLIGSYGVLSLLTIPQALVILGVGSLKEPDFYWFLNYSLVSVLLMVGLLRYRAFRFAEKGKALRHALSEAQRQEQLLSARVEEQSELVTMLVHELKTPLSVISLAMGSSGAIPEVRKRALSAMQSVQELIDRCAQVAQLEHAHINAESILLLQPIDPMSVLSDAISLQRHPDVIDVNEVKPLPACVTDTQMLLLILRNLLDNAIKYGATDTRVRVYVEARAREAHDGVVVGISNAIGRAGKPDPQRLFDKYYRNSKARYRSGSGLGLYLSKRLAVQLGGELYLVAGDDVTFELWLPCSPPESPRALR